MASVLEGMVGVRREQSGLQLEDGGAVKDELRRDEGVSGAVAQDFEVPLSAHCNDFVRFEGFEARPKVWLENFIGHFEREQM